MGFIAELTTDLNHRFVEVFHALVGGLEPGAERTLIQLLCLGEYGWGAGTLKREFLSLGILHLLVLSGSQVSAFMGAWRWLTAPFVKPRSLMPPPLQPVADTTGLLAFLCLVSPDPPIVRAALMEGLRVAFPRARVDLLVLGALGLQLAMFPAHASSLSFLLSWSCWLLLAFSQLIPSRAAGLVTLTLACQVGAIILTSSPWPSGAQWGLIVGANMCLLWVFETWVFPLCGLLMALTIATAPWGAESGLAVGVSEIAHPILDGVAGLILVALGAFRYIQEEIWI